jgi:glycosyltransferase involved in cell wall biosynthesis
MRLAVVQQGVPTDASSWSGVPQGLISGLRENGCEVVPVGAAFRGSGRVGTALRLSWAEQEASRGFAAVSGRIADRALKAARPLDAVVMIGSSYSLTTSLPIVSFEDMTVSQALRIAPEKMPLSDAAARRWVARQARNYRRTIGCCVASEWAAQSVRDEYGVPAARVHVVGFGSNVGLGRGEDRDWAVPSFLFGGFDWERKGGASVVEAFTAVRERFPTARLDLVGRHPPIDVAGVTGHGPLPLDSEAGQRQYAEILGRATCFVMPSRIEPFGIAYLDAARAGIASIGTTVGGAADAIGDAGTLVEPGEKTALVAAMSEFADPEVAHRCGDRARERAEGFTWAAVGGRVLEVVRQGT